jgi:hypothetical protein
VQALAEKRGELDGHFKSIEEERKEHEEIKRNMEKIDRHRRELKGKLK